MDAIEQSPEHQVALQKAPLRGHAREYLGAFSVQMTARGETSIVEADGLSAISSVSDKLHAAKQIVETPDPREILDELLKRHVLVRAEDGSFRFQHQQFQEFFAAGRLRAHLDGLVRAKDLIESSLCPT
jgi:hypothetical protein